MPARSSHGATKRRKELERQRKAQEKLERRHRKRKQADAEETEETEQPAPLDEIPAKSDGEPTTPPED